MTSYRRRVNPLLSVDSFFVEVDGKGAGLALSLGERLQFFSADPKLRAIDGRRYRNIEDIRHDVKTLRGAVSVEPAA